jgi:hypothetical protein
VPEQEPRPPQQPIGPDFHDVDFDRLDVDAEWLDPCPHGGGYNPNGCSWCQDAAAEAIRRP